MHGGAAGREPEVHCLFLPRCLGGPHSLASTDLAPSTDLALDLKHPLAAVGAALSSLHSAPAKAQNSDCQCLPAMVLPADLTESGLTAHSVKTQLFNPEI